MERRQVSLLFFIGVSSSLMAEEVQELEPVIVSAPLHKKASETVHPVNILEGDDLALKQATTVGETLKQELGIHSMSFAENQGNGAIAK